VIAETLAIPFAAYVQGAIAMRRTSFVMLAIVLILTALPFTAAANQQPGEQRRTEPAALPAPDRPIPPDGTRFGGMGPITLQWNLPVGATQYHLQVVPFNGDGPGIDLIRNAESQFTIPAPPTWYVMLPVMTYSWQVRVSDSPTGVGPGDPSWSAWAGPWRFTTPNPSADTISATEPVLGGRATSTTPTLVWTDANPGIFYYEIQLSSDPLFNTDPFTATAAVYWNLIHGGQTSPQNSWAVPASGRLDANISRYYWRVRPRVQGNGTPVNWGLPFWFTVGPSGGGCLVCPDLAVTDVQLSASNVVAGSQVQVQYTVKNVGAGGSAPTDVRALLSNEVTINRLRTDLGPLGTLSALTSQQSVVQFATVTIPGNTPVGSYFLGVYADWAGVNKEAEGGKDGNNGLGKLLVVTVPVTPVPGVTPPPTDTPTATPSPTATLTPSPTATNTPSLAATMTPTPGPLSRTFISKSDASVGFLISYDRNWPMSGAEVYPITSVNDAVGAGKGYPGPGYYYTERGFISFDTSAIPASATILAASVSIYPAPNSFADSDRTSLEIVTASQGSALGVDDWSRIGSTSFGSVPLVSLQQGEMNNMTLTSSGLAGITKGGITQFALRLGLDLYNRQPVAGNQVVTYLDNNSARGIKLNVTYRVN
ncbi:MAG: hypothetical protein NTZ05_20835, partial [Chloroflexi bacterium]|nr:hypothetical protein [Chloroflexota bacterium]